MATAKYKRILLQLPSEALMGGRRNGIDPEMIARIADEIVDMHRARVEIAIGINEAMTGAIC